MNTELISKALCFHGQPLQKIWAGERGDHDLYQLGITNPDFSLYLERQKNLTFQDRAKRLKLHQFLARKANELFDRGLQNGGSNIKQDSSNVSRQDVAETVVSMPPYEYFLNTTAHEKIKVLHCALESVKPGHIVYGVVTKPYSSGPQVKVLCTGEPLVRYLADINIRAVLPNTFMIPGHDKKGNPKSYAIHDFVCCEVLDISIDAERMTLGMKGVLTKDTTAPLGLISAEQIPDYYRRINSGSDEVFQDYLTTSKTFNNSNCYEALYESVGLDIHDTFSHLRSLKYPFPMQDYAIELRQTQASKWAFRSVADGIEHFKIGRHVEAFQCLNKALSIDPRNVEGLVARGALYANKGSFIKAVEDFETALKLNAFHTNARKYMGETLVALGRSYEEDNHIEEAIKAYQNCLNIIPNHEQARISLDALKRRPGHANPVIDINLLSLPGTSDVKKKKKSKHRSSSSSSSSDDSSDTSTDSTSSDASSTSESESDRQKKKQKKQKSLSPLSKRMGDMNAGSFEFSQPFHLMQKEQDPDFNKVCGVHPPLTSGTLKPTLFQMDDFLGAGDDDYETRVRKLLEDASKHRKERDGKSSGSKKKSKKKRKKAKKEAARLEKKNKSDSLAAENTCKTSETSLEKYERSLKELKTYQQQQKVTVREDLFVDNEEPPPAPSFSMRLTGGASPRKAKRESSPPRTPSMSTRQPQLTSTSTKAIRPPPPIISGPSSRSAISTFSIASNNTASFKPFPIKGPVVLDKFGCFRLVAPPPEEVEALTRRRTRTRSRSRSRSKLHARRWSRSRSRSRSAARRRRRRSSSRSRRRSPSRGRRSRSRGHWRSTRSRGRRSRSRGRRSRSSVRRRTPSPFNPNRRPRSRTPGRQRTRSPQKDDHKSGQSTRDRRAFGNRVWQRPVDAKERNGSKSPNSSGDEQRRNDKSTRSDTSLANAGTSSASGSVDGSKHDKLVKEDGISLEEIDKIITQAKKERKEEILQRDKKILKKNAANNF